MMKYLDIFVGWGLVLLCGVVLALLAAGCVSPDKWSPANHQETMKFCSLSCGDGRMASYRAWDAKCECASTVP